MKKSGSNKVSLLNEEFIEGKVEQLWHEESGVGMPLPLKETTWKRIKRTVQKNHLRTLYRIAAMVVAILGISGILLFRQNQVITTVVVNDGITPKSIDLRDGSTVILNRNSEISFTTDNDRAVSLKGEGYFKIKKDSLHPFKVLTDSLAVMVYGTEFNVYAYPKDQEVSVSLYTGKVHILETNGITLNMSPGEKYSKDFSRNQTYISEFNKKIQVDWMTSKIICVEMQMSELLKKISNYYDVDFELAEKSIADKFISGTFKIDNGIEHFLNIISFSHDIEYTQIDQKTYRLNQKEK
ncbi:FecR family protein [Robertkochia solimangrovi]|uniref:FecR family protein n=1 Tax=Robertkochia solimangrovi TaxID=2213046 RepID=UPI00117C7BE1|nr:FecR family protein [Robertkochia solimangrovi]TRZ43536.1 hypothetical protein DMZ48_08920 [Robertkochia solimangrovi]